MSETEEGMLPLYGAVIELLVAVEKDSSQIFGSAAHFVMMKQYYACLCMMHVKSI